MGKKVIGLLLAFALLCAGAPAALAAEAGLSNFQRTDVYPDGKFTDVRPGVWYEESVKTAFEMGLIKGDSETRFNPGGNITIAESLTLASRLHSVYHGNGSSFPAEKPWYKAYVDYAAANGIISANSYSNFDAKATRAQFVKIFAAAFPAEALSQINTVEDGVIPDVPVTASYANAVYTLYRAGILLGNDSKGTFAPQSNILRSEVAAILVRMADVSQRKYATFEPGPVEASSVILNCGAGAMQELEVGSSFTLTATVFPSGADQNVTWSSSASRIAAVDAYGTVTGVSAGTAVITASTSNGKSVSCTVKVVAKSQPAVICYAKFPGVPDFGALMGIRPYTTSSATSSFAYIYSIDSLVSSGHAGDCVDLYNAALLQCGFNYFTSFKDDSGHTVIVYRHPTLPYSVMMGTVSGRVTGVMIVVSSK